MPEKIIGSDDEIFPALEIATDVSVAPSGDYYVHIKDQNGRIDIPFWCLENIMQFVPAAIDKYKRSLWGTVDQSKCRHKSTDFVVDVRKYQCKDCGIMGSSGFFGIKDPDGD